MRFRQVFAVAFAVCLAAPLVSAQDTETYSFATYYRCNQATETRADEIYKETFEPLIQKQVEAGRLRAHGWARHWVGGEWRRLQYLVATDLAALVDAREAIIEELIGTHSKAADEFSSICPSHDDYIWSSVASSQAPGEVAQERSNVVMSTYFQCDSREKEADAIMKTAFAPVLSAHVKEGKIAAWNWLEHLAGGKYRRLLVFDGADHKSILEYWNTLDQALQDAQPELARRFTDICHSHTDYVWDIGTE